MNHFPRTTVSRPRTWAALAKRFTTTSGEGRAQAGRPRTKAATAAHPITRTVRAVTGASRCEDGGMKTPFPEGMAGNMGVGSCELGLGGDPEIRWGRIRPPLVRPRAA